MRRLNPLTEAEALAYNLRDGGSAVTIFADAQTARVGKARELLGHLLGDGRRRIVELGCSAGDISGPFSTEHEVTGIDIVPAAIAASRQRYPAMDLIETAIESVTPIACDVLVLCEILEHLADPFRVIRDWLPGAGAVVIGHPLVGDGSDPEPGHLWAYDQRDFENWFLFAGFGLDEAFTFEMGGYQMIIGSGRRA